MLHNEVSSGLNIVLRYWREYLDRSGSFRQDCW